MAFIDKHSTAYRQFNKWQKWLSCFSQNAWAKILYALVLSMLLVESINVICVLKLFTVNKYLMLGELAYVNLIQFGWLHSWYTIAKDQTVISPAKYNKILNSWLIMTILLFAVTTFVTINNNFIIATSVITIAWALSAIFYETIIFKLHHVSFELHHADNTTYFILLLIFTYTCLLVATNVPVLAFAIDTEIKYVSKYIVLLIFCALMILTYLLLDGLLKEQGKTSVRDWNDVKIYNDKATNKSQQVSANLHNVTNNQRAHCYYLVIYCILLWFNSMYIFNAINSNLCIKVAVGIDILSVILAFIPCIYPILKIIDFLLIKPIYKVGYTIYVYLFKQNY